MLNGESWKAGYTGDGFLDFGNGVGEWIDFDFEAVDGRPHWFAVRYANGGSSPRPVEMLVDGTVVATLAMRPTKPPGPRTASP